MSPLKLFEYMASQRPIISSDLPSVREILDESNCLFCKPDNHKDLAVKILKLIKDSELSKKIANKAFRDVQKYTWDRRVKKILKNT
jgi:glycosyltransferase involved in cell wall biosynthesis